MSRRQRNAFLDRAAIVRRLENVGEQTRAALLHQNKYHDLQRLRGELTAHAPWMPAATREALHRELVAKTAELARPQRVLQRVELGGTGLRYPPPAAPKKKAGKKKK